MFVLCVNFRSSMFFFRGNSRTFRCSGMLLNGVFTICKTRTFLAFGGSSSSMLIFRGNSRAFRCSATSGPRTDVDFIFRGNSRTFRCSATSGPRTNVHFSW